MALRKLPPLITVPRCYRFPRVKLHLRTRTVFGKRVTLQARAMRSLRREIVPAMAKAGIPIAIVWSYRSCALQCALCKYYGVPCDVGKPGVVAAAGKSFHNIGLAIDINRPPTHLIAKYRAIMGEFHWFNFSGANGQDPNHWSYQVEG